MNHIQIKLMTHALKPAFKTFNLCSGLSLGEQTHHGSKVVHKAVLIITKTRHVDMSNEVTSQEIYASIKHLMWIVL